MVAFADFLAAQQKTEKVTFTPPPGGLMTVEVGVITGLVELWVVQDRAKVSYVGSSDIYTVAGHIPDGWTFQQVTVYLFADPGVGPDGNPLWVQFPERRS